MQLQSLGMLDTSVDMQTRVRVQSKRFHKLNGMRRSEECMTEKIHDDMTGKKLPRRWVFASSSSIFDE